MTTTTMDPHPQKLVLPPDEATGAFGLYLTYVVYNLDTVGLGAKDYRLVRQESFFLADNLLSKCVRPRGEPRAAWRPFPLPNHDDARKLMTRSIGRYKSGDNRIEMVHIPLVVELRLTDIEAVRKHEPPFARFAAADAVTKAIGNIDDDVWRPSDTF